MLKCCFISLAISVLALVKKSLGLLHALEYLISCEIITPCVRFLCMLLDRKGKELISNLKSSLLSYNLVIISLLSIVISMSRKEVFVGLLFSLFRVSP